MTGRTMADTKKTVLDTKNDIIRYTDKLTPPEGYSLSFAVGTTYSLDMNAFGQALIALDNTDRVIDPHFSLKNAIENLSGKVILFHDAGALKALDKEIYKTVDHFFISINKLNGAFHPKIWLMRFKCNADPKMEKFRLLVLSRNMSFDKSLDLIYAMDGEWDENEDCEAKNKPLCDLLEFLTDKTGLDEPRENEIGKLNETLKHVVFKTNDAEVFDDFEFMLSTPDNKLFADSDLFKGPFKDLLIMSPFLKEITVSNLFKNAEKVSIITREDQLKELIKPLNDNAGKDISVFILNYENSSEDFKDYNLHAKLYVTKNKKEQNLYIGSANATYGASNNNVEFLIRLHCRENAITLLRNDMKNGKLFKKVEDFEKNNEPTNEEKERKEVDNLFRELSRLEVTAKAEKNNNGLYDISLTFTITDKFKKDAIGYTIEIMPGSAGEAKKLDSNMVYRDIEQKNIGFFYSVRICKTENGTLLKDGMLNIHTVVDEDIWDKRNKEVFSSIFTLPRINAYNRSSQYKSNAETKTRKNTETDEGEPYPSVPIPDQAYEIMLKHAAEDNWKDPGLKLYSSVETSELYKLFEQALEAMKS